jgi:hypothetical protein
MKYYKRRKGLRWEVVYTAPSDSLVRPVTGLPLFWRWYNAEAVVLALVWAREMGAYFATLPEPPR